jgi:hypothetical protein
MKNCQARRTKGYIEGSPNFGHKRARGRAGQPMILVQFVKRLADGRRSA